MFIEQIYTDCLAEASYYIESGNEAIIIDPMRDYSPHIELARKRNVNIKYVFETHFHADFVSGHIDLANETGATIIFGPNATPEYNAHIAKDNEEIFFGNIRIKVLHTPGHTLESSSYLLFDEKNEPHAIFTGDTLFIGDVGRPDLAVKSNLSQFDLAGLLFESIKRIKSLNENVIVYPGHGAGSSCGKNIGNERSSTIGLQKSNNYALQINDKSKFIEAITEGLTAPPPYFFHDAMINKKGYTSLESIINNGMIALTIQDIEKMNSNENVLIDTRNVENFEKGYISKSINIGLNGKFASWVGELIKPDSKIIIIAEDENKSKESIMRLARIGYHNVVGYLANGYKYWEKKIKQKETIESINANELGFHQNSVILDVRKQNEYETNHYINAINSPLQNINQFNIHLNNDDNTFVYCQAGYRSMIFTSILKSRGYKNITNIRGGYNEIEKIFKN